MGRQERQLPGGVAVRALGPGSAGWSGAVARTLRQLGAAHQASIPNLQCGSDSPLSRAVNGPQLALGGLSLVQALERDPLTTQAWLCQLDSD